VRLKNLHLWEKEKSHMREGKQINGERKKKTQQTDQTLHKWTKTIADCCKVCSSREAWNGEKPHSEPFAEKWKLSLKVRVNNIWNIHTILHLGWCWTGLLWLINLRWRERKIAFVWIAFFTMGFDPNILGAGPGTQNNMLHFIQSIYCLRATELRSSRESWEKYSWAVELCNWNLDWVMNFNWN